MHIKPTSGELSKRSHTTQNDIVVLNLPPHRE